MKLYLDAIHKRVCPSCRYAILSQDQETVLCNLPAGKTCAIERFLPELVEIAESIQGSSVENYWCALRCNVCSTCDQFQVGKCPITGIGNCTLDNHFLEVVDVVREINLRTRKQDEPIMQF